MTPTAVHGTLCLRPLAPRSQNGERRFVARLGAGAVMRLGVGLMLASLWFPAVAAAQSNGLRITSIAPFNRTNMLIQWQGATGSVWVQRKTSDLPDWVDISPALASNGFVAPIDTSARGAVQFRLRTAVPAVLRPKLAGFLSAVGVAHDVVTRSNVAYVASDTFGLSFVRITPTGAPVLLDSADVPFNGTAVALAGTNACVIGSRTSGAGAPLFTNLAGFYVVDVSATNPVVRGMIESSSEGFLGVAASGNRAFLACGNDGLRIVDISNPASPRFIGTNDTPGFAYAVTVVGDLAFVADGPAGLRILNVSNPSAPGLVGFLDTPGPARDVAVDGPLAFVADSTSLQIIDVSNPAAPVRRGSLTLAANRVSIQRGLAFVAVGGAGLVLVDVSNPDLPVQVSVLPAAGHPNASTLACSLSGSFAVLANREGGIAVADVSVPVAPVARGTLMEWFDGYKVATEPGMAVVTGTRYWNGGSQTQPGLRVLNMTNPASPSVLAALDTPGVSFYGVALAGPRAYLAAGAAGLRVLDLGNRARPVFIGTNDTPGFAYSVAIAGNLAYVADGTMGLRILSITNPAAPVAVGWLDTPGTARDVAVAGNVACVADNNSVRIVDVSNPAAPVERGAVGCAALEIKMQGSLAFAALGGGGLQIIDISNPAAPALLGSLPPAGSANASTLGVAVAGNFAYLANREGGLAVVDVSLPSRPILRYAVSTLSSALGVTADGSWLCLSDALGTVSTVSLTP